MTPAKTHTRITHTYNIFDYNYAHELYSVDVFTGRQMSRVMQYTQALGVRTRFCGRKSAHILGVDTSEHICSSIICAYIVPPMSKIEKNLLKHNIDKVNK